MIKIQEDYWTGSECLANEVPWVVPKAVYFIDSLCKPHDSVLDIGTGGSTIFYARRCLFVRGIETNPEWFSKVRCALYEKGISHVTYELIEKQEAIEASLRLLAPLNIISVDSVHGYNRSVFLDIALTLNPEVLILDNYACDVLFPQHYNKSLEEMIALCPGIFWQGKDFDDSHWVGNGTRVLWRLREPRK